MATVPPQRRTREVEYPSGDGKPMAETQIHLKDMIDTIQVLDDYFADQPNVYVLSVTESSFVCSIPRPASDY